LDYNELTQNITTKLDNDFIFFALAKKTQIHGEVESHQEHNIVQCANVILCTVQH